MKHINHFRELLSAVVNLNQTRIDQLEASIETLKGLVRTGYNGSIIGFDEHGSWPHKTIIKPQEGRPFDADLLLNLRPKDGWQAKDYLAELRRVFSDHGTYTGMVRGSSHCVTIEYAGERRIDIAVVIVDRERSVTREVCNGKDNVFEATEPRQYTDWWNERNHWLGSNLLRYITRLAKYLRDIKLSFSCQSVVLTTLLGMQVTEADRYQQHLFADLPTALKTLVGRVDDWLQRQPSRPVLLNPVLSTEDLGKKWDDAQYTNFRDKFHKYREWIDDAYDEADEDESIGKWRRVFGDDFAKAVAIDKAASVSNHAAALVTDGLAKVAGIREDLVALFARKGRAALPFAFDRLPHKQRPAWRSQAGANMRLTVRASLHGTRRGPKLSDLPALNTSPLPKEHFLKFTVANASGLSLGGEFDVHWRVTNTDLEAANANSLRGTFVDADDGTSRWEHLLYRGVHTVEAFVVRRRDGILMGQSDPFYVTIE